MAVGSFGIPYVCVFSYEYSCARSAGPCETKISLTIKWEVSLHPASSSWKSHSTWRLWGCAGLCSSLLASNPITFPWDAWDLYLRSHPSKQAKPPAYLLPWIWLLEYSWLLRLHKYSKQSGKELGKLFKWSKVTSKSTSSGNKGMPVHLSIPFYHISLV